MDDLETTSLKEHKEAEDLGGIQNIPNKSGTDRL